MSLAIAAAQLLYMEGTINAECQARRRIWEFERRVTCAKFMLALFKHQNCRVKRWRVPTHEFDDMKALRPGAELRLFGIPVERGA